MMMNNTLMIDGQPAVISFDPDIAMFRGEFIGLNGGADFYATDVAGLIREGATSLRIFLEECEKAGIEPRRSFSGKLSVRLDPKVHEAAATAAAAQGQSLNQFVEQSVKSHVAALDPTYALAA